MAELDPLVLKMFADTEQLRRELQRTTRTIDQHLGIQEARVRKLEDEFRRSSGAIGSTLKGLAGTLAAAFTGRELVGLIDNYTRLQNQLRVSGLEGEKLASVQAKLFELAAKNGTSANSLAELYSKASQAGREFGATEQQLLQVTENTALALRVSGVSAEQASGAILGLAQALAAGKVNAEDYAQINEGGLRPLLQAAAASERFGGSVNKLRAEVYAGTLTSRDFFDAILSGSEAIRSQAAGSVLTISGAITSLNQRLTEFVGSQASASGAAGLLSSAIEKLAENIGDVIEALAVITLAIGSRYALAMGAAIVRTAGLGAAAIGLGVTLNGVAATARASGVAIAGALGGAPALAAGALAAGVVILATRFGETERAADDVRKAVEQQGQELGTLRAKTLDAAAANNTLDTEQRQIITGVASLTGEVDKLSTAWGRVAAAAKSAALEQAQATLDAALGKQIETRLTSNVRREAFDRTARRPFAERGLGRDALPTNRAEAIAASDRAAAADPEQSRIERIAAANVRAAQRQLEQVRKRELAAFAPPAAAAPAPTKTTGGSNSRGTESRGPTVDVEAANLRFLEELAAIQSRILGADAERATSAEQRASFDRQQLELAEASALRSLAADEELTEAQKAQLLLRLSALGAAEREAISFRERAEIERRNADLADERGRASVDALRLQFDLATTEKERRSIALQILDAEQGLLRQRLEAQVNSQTLNDIDKERARIALAALDAQAGAQRESVGRQFASPLERFAQGAQDSDQRVEEAAVRRIQDLNTTITDAMTNALGIKDPFLSELISIFLDRNVFGPLAEALSNGDLQGNGGGIVAGIGSLLGGLFGRSSGGRVDAGSVYRINEGASPGRVEAFRPDVSGQIIPLGRMNAMQSGGSGGAAGTVRVVIEEAPGFAARVQTEATGVAIEVVRQSAPGIVDAAASETFRRANRPGL